MAPGLTVAALDSLCDKRLGCTFFTLEVLKNNILPSRKSSKAYQEMELEDSVRCRFVNSVSFKRLAV
jgi:hypothetical protein